MKRYCVVAEMNERINFLFLLTTTASGFLEKRGRSEIWRQAVPGDVSVDKERDEIVEKGLFKKACPVFVFSAVKLYKI